MKKSFSQIPNFANDYYSIATNNEFDIKNKLRVAHQIKGLLDTIYNKEQLKKIKCLDVGSSTGIITNYLAQFLNRITGIDVDSSALSYAKKNYSKKNLRFIFGSGDDIPFKDNSFDLIICHQVLACVGNQQKVIDEIFRVLRPGGKAYISTNNILFPFEPEYKLPLLQYLPNSIAKSYVRIMGHNKFYLHHYNSYWSLKKMLKEFLVDYYSPLILKNPDKYKFKNLVKYKKIINVFPEWLVQIASLFAPTFIFILEKPKKLSKHKPLDFER